MRTRQQRQSHGVDIFLQSCFSDLLGGLVETRIDDLEPMVAECSSDGLCASVMPIKSGLGNDDSVWPLHKRETLRHQGVIHTFARDGAEL
jgi:hypothetical protein